MLFWWKDVWENIFLIYSMLETIGKTTLKIDDYDSMSVEHVSVNSEMIFTSVRSGLFSLAAPKN